MNRKMGYWLVSLFALLGTALSGYLTWRYKWGGGCPIDGKTFFTCGGVTIFGQPTCVYGLVMFALLLILALVGLSKLASQRLLNTVLVISVVGTLFSASLSVYELWIKKIAVWGLPACVYGFFLYVGALIVVLFMRRASLALEIPPATPPTPQQPTPLQQ